MMMPAMLRKLDDGLLHGRAVRNARAVLAARTPAQQLALRQALLLLETATRVVEPVEQLPAGSRAAVLVSLYRDAAYWALLAGWTGEGEAPSDLRALWAETSPETLAKAGPESTLAAVRATLADSAGAVPLEVTDEDAGRARAFVEALVKDLGVPRARLDRALAHRWMRFAGVVAVVLAAVWGVRQLTLGPDLAAGKPFRTSSSWAGCAADPPCPALMFHTDDQDNPWVEIDLGSAKTVHRIEVNNRTDCCSERAIPAVVEVSVDHTKWSQVGRHDDEFRSWAIKFQPRQVRYVKVSVPRRTTFHLKSVKVR